MDVRLGKAVLILAGEEWSNCFTLKDISLPQNPYVGLTAMTGDVSDAHEYVLFWFPSSVRTTYLTVTLSASSRSRRPLPFSPPLSYHATNCSRQKRRQAGPCPPLYVSCSLGVHSPGSGLAGENMVEGSLLAPEIPVCLGEVEAVCGLTVSGSKSTNRCVRGFVQTARVWPFMVVFQALSVSVRWAPRGWRRL